MADYYDPFRPWLQEHPDHNHADQRQAVERLLLLDDLTQAYLADQVEIDVLWDAMAEQDIDPIGWTDSALAGVERIVDGGMRFVSNDAGLFLPER